MWTIIYVFLFIYFYFYLDRCNRNFTVRSNHSYVRIRVEKSTPNVYSSCEEILQLPLNHSLAGECYTLPRIKLL
jgi:hypothetical protein